jgi:hypothetical protein
VHTTLVAALWVANRAFDLARAVVDSVAYRLAVAAIDAASDALKAGEVAVASTSQAAKLALETAKRTGEAAVNAAVWAVEFARTKGAEAIAYALTQHNLEVFEAGVDAALSVFTTVVDELWKSSEYIAFGVAQ